MDYKINIEERDTYIYVKASGRYHHQEAKKSLYQVLDVCYKNSVTRILVDYREQQGNPNLIQRLDYLVFITSAIKDLFPNLTEKIRLVYLGPELKVSGKDRSQKIIEQSGVHLWGTTDQSQALDWLLASH